MFQNLPLLSLQLFLHLLNNLSIMKRLNLLIGSVLLVLNVIIGLLLTSYATFNMILTSGIIVISIALIEILKHIKLKDAFRISLSALFALFLIINFILGILSPERFQDNGYIIAILIIIAFELLVLMTTSFVSNKVK